MNKDSEEWNAKEWMECLTLREKVMADYLRLLQKYNRLPAVDILVERELAKKYGDQTLDETFDAIVPPANYIIHEWDKDEHPEAVDVGGEFEDAPDGEVESKETRLGETCYTGITDIINSWVECLKVKTPPVVSKFTLAVLEALSQVGCYVFSATNSSHEQQDARSVALIQFSINKCVLIEQCMMSFRREMDAVPELVERLQNTILHLQLLQNLLNEYLSEVLTPGNMN